MRVIYVFVHLLPLINKCELYEWSTNSFEDIQSNTFHRTVYSTYQLILYFTAKRIHFTLIISKYRYRTRFNYTFKYLRIGNQFFQFEP